MPLDTRTTTKTADKGKQQQRHFTEARGYLWWLRVAWRSHVIVKIVSPLVLQNKTGCLRKNWDSVLNNIISQLSSLSSFEIKFKFDNRMQVLNFYLPGDCTAALSSWVARSTWSELEMDGRLLLIMLVINYK